MNDLTRRRALQIAAGFGAVPILNPISSCAEKGNEEMTMNDNLAVSVGSISAIDAHIHACDVFLPGLQENLLAPDGTPLQSSLEKVAEGIRNEMKSGGIVHLLGMPCWKRTDGDPLGVERMEQLTPLIPGLHLVGLADPTRTDARHLGKVEEVLKRGRVKALKAYLGYLHYEPSDSGYQPYYRLAARYRIPFFFHTGDVYSHLGKLKYAHPLLIDEVAVDHPEVNFIIAHLGCPWFSDAAEVVYKNNKTGIRENVWVDLSGVVVGGAGDFETYRKQGILQTMADRIREALYYAGRPDRFLYGSDWPLSPMATYRKFVEEAIPSEYHQAVFHDNAKQLFGL